MKIAYLGPEGTFSQDAADRFKTECRLEDAAFVPVMGISRVLSELSAGVFDAAVVPLKNTLAGDYRETVAGIAEHKFRERGSLVMTIELAIGIHPATSAGKITEIRSKDTALKECSQFLAARFPGAVLTEVSSTGDAMRQVVSDNLLHVAAVGSEMGLRRYGLTQIASRIENPGENVTTFLLLEPRRG